MLRLLSSLLCILCVLASEHAWASAAVLTWDAPTGNASPVLGYRLHYGVQPGLYTTHISVGDVTTYTLTGLSSSFLYYVAATALYDAGESGFSNEVLINFAASPQLGFYYLNTAGNDNNSCAAAQSQTTPKRTFASVLPCLAGGSTLFLFGGTYPESLDTAVVPIASGVSWAAATTIAAFPGHTVTLQPASGGKPVIWIQAGSYMIFDHLILDANNLSGTNGFATNVGADHIRFQNGEIKNTFYETFYVNQGSHIEMLTSSLHNSATLSTITVSGCDACVVHGNDIFSSSYEGISQRSGVANSNLEISGNAVHNNGSASMSASIVVKDGTGALVMNNLVYANSIGINVQSAANGLKLYNNTVYGNTGVGLQIDAGATGTLVNSNIVYNNGSAIVDNGAGTVQTTNVISDPLFVSAPTNFQLQSGSIARDTGTCLTEVPVDYVNLVRPQGAFCDVGAYERPITAVPRPPTGLLVMF